MNAFSLQVIVLMIIYCPPLEVNMAAYMVWHLFYLFLSVLGERHPPVSRVGWSVWSVLWLQELEQNEGLLPLGIIIFNLRAVLVYSETQSNCSIYDYCALTCFFCNIQNVQMMEASLYDKIMDQQRLEPEFFRVGFYGKKFPFFLRVSGNTYQKLTHSLSSVPQGKTNK